MNYLAYTALVLVPATVLADNWPQFRGGGSMTAESKTLPAVWDTTKNVVWKADVPGRGWSSPIVWGDRIYLSTVVSDKDADAPKKGLYIENLQGKTPPGDHRWLVLCLDFRTGKTLWEREVHKGKPPAAIHVKNTYASATPVTDGERVVTYFGNLGVFCHDRDGKLLWEQRIEPTPTALSWGPAASLALYKERVLLVNDNDKQSYIQALDIASGRELWKTKRPEKSNWATPFVWETPQRTEVVTASQGKIRSYDLDGKPLWELGGMSTISIPSPFAHGGLLYVTSGYVGDFQRRPIYAIKPGAAGDITLKDKETSNTFIAWSHKLGGPYHPTPLAYGDYLYVLLDRGMLSCYEAKTGKQVYDRKRLGPTEFTASPWAYDGKVFCLSEAGETVVVKAGKDFEVLDKNKLDDMALATPALANGSLLVRTMSKLYRFEKR